MFGAFHLPQSWYLGKKALFLAKKGHEKETDVGRFAVCQRLSLLIEWSVAILPERGR